MAMFLAILISLWIGAIGGYFARDFAIAFSMGD